MYTKYYCHLLVLTGIASIDRVIIILYTLLCKSSLNDGKHSWVNCYLEFSKWYWYNIVSYIWSNMYPQRERYIATTVFDNIKLLFSGMINGENKWNAFIIIYER